MPLQPAAALVHELRDLRTRFAALPLAHGCEWVDRELHGYPREAPVPRYRRIPCETWADIADAEGRVERIPLPTAHLADGGRTPVREGIVQLQEIEVPIDRAIDPQAHALYLRGMPSQPGLRILRAWETIPPASLHGMLDAIRAYGQAMHEDALRRASALPTSRRG